VPFGYRRSGDGLAIDPDAAEQVRVIFKMARAGKSQRQIAERTGLPPTTIAGILSRDIYKRAKPARIVDPRIWNAARRSTAKRNKRSGAV
jgi:DNA invertase Pin-like site-specific DNA recombinase